MLSLLATAWPLSRAESAPPATVAGTKLGDDEARAIVAAAFASRGMPLATLPELQAVQAIGRFEGGYGRGWKAQGAGSHNWGAIQCGHYAPCGPGCFPYGDSHADGEKYQGCFRIYADDVAGCADLVRELYRRSGVPEAMRAGDATMIAERMRATGYFEAPADQYAGAIENHARAIAAALDEPHVVVRGGGKVAPTEPPALPPPPEPPHEPPPAIPVAARRGGGGAFVLLSLAAGGIFLLSRRRR